MRVCACVCLSVAPASAKESPPGSGPGGEGVWGRVEGEMGEVVPGH